MLVLSRKRGQRIRIGKDIFITINEIMQTRVVIGIEAPDDVRVLREELIEEPPTEEVSHVQ